MHSRQARERALLFCLSSGGGGLVAKSCPTLATPWTVACQVPLSMEFPGRNTVVDCHFLLQGYNIVNKVDNMV